jgi:hypothetical protein
MSIVVSRATARAVAAVWWLLALAFVVSGTLAVLQLGITELYADQWRQYLPYVQEAFPASAFVADNGHRSVFPALIRLAELHWMDGNQWLQLLAGLMFALTAWGIAARIALRDGTLAWLDRAVAVAVVAFAIFWLGNARMLLHGNESANVYLIMLSLVAAVALAMDRAAGAPRLTGAGALGVVAAFSFGPGLAVFVGVIAVLLLQRRWRAAAGLAIAMFVTLAVYMAIPGGDGVRNSLHIAPLANLRTAATWLSSMWLHLLLPLVDIDVAARVPFGLSGAAQAIARGWQALFGNPWHDVLPFTVAGMAGLAWLAWLSARAVRRDAGPAMLLGLGMAWFAFAVAGIVALGREEYFAAHPGQIVANRYVPWSCLFWAGLLVAAIGARGTGSGAAAAVASGERTDAAAPVARLRPLHALVLAILFLGLATNGGFRVWSRIVQNGVRVDAAGFASGVVDATASFGETVSAEVVHGLPVLREARVSMFAWPEARLIGTQVIPDAQVGNVGREPASVDVRPVGNLLGGTAMRIEAVFWRRHDTGNDADASMPRRLLLVEAGEAIGILVHRADTDGGRYAGYARREVPMDRLVYARLDGEGRPVCFAGCDVMR